MHSHPIGVGVAISQTFQGTVRFTRDASDHVSGFVLNGGRIRNFNFTRRGK